MARKKVTEGSQVLTFGEAYKLMMNYRLETISDTKYFKKDIGNLLEDIVTKKKYYNEAGIKALGNLLKKKVEIEVSVSSESDERKKYRCVKFKDGSTGCTCVNFVTYQNVLRPKGKCKHIQTLIDNEIF